MIFDNLIQKFLALTGNKAGLREPAASVLALGMIDNLTNDIAGYYSNGTFYNSAGVAVFSVNSDGSITYAVGTSVTGQVILLDGAITRTSGTVVITKATAAAITLAAPTATTDDFKRLTIVSTTAAAHTVTQTTPGFNNGSTASDIATFGAAIGNAMEVVAYQGVWYTLQLRNVTLA